MLRDPGINLCWNWTGMLAPDHSSLTFQRDHQLGLCWGALSLSPSFPFPNEAISPLSTFSSFLFQRNLGPLNADGYTPDPVGEHLQSPLFTGDRTGDVPGAQGFPGALLQNPFLTKAPRSAPDISGPCTHTGLPGNQALPHSCLTQEVKPCPIPIFH